MIKNLQNFRKIALTSIALLAVSFGVKAQSWYVMGEYLWSPPHPQGTYELTYSCGETTQIGGLDYITIYENTKSKIGAYRNEDNQVYYCKWNGSAYEEEVLLYDYDLQVGDYFNDLDEHPMQVTAITTITDHNGFERKKYEFYFMGLPEETEFWIEGVGSNKGFVNSGNYTPTSDGAIFHLLCYHVDDNLIYVNPEFDTCDITEIEENKTENSVSIYPNPANDQIHIEGLVEASEISLYNAFGTCVKKLTLNGNEEIAIDNLAAGLYLLRINKKQAVKFLKR